MEPQERLLLESLDSLLQSDAGRAGIRPIVEQVRRNLAEDRAASMAWASIPSPVYGRSLPGPIQSSWVFILRARTETGAERHPNSHQRMLSYEGSGDLQTGGDGSIVPRSAPPSQPQGEVSHPHRGLPPRIVVGDAPSEYDPLPVISVQTLERHGALLP